MAADISLLLLGIVLGVIAIAGARHAVDTLWAVVLIVIGIIAGGIAGILVLLGGIIGLIGKII